MHHHVIETLRQQAGANGKWENVINRFTKFGNGMHSRGENRWHEKKLEFNSYPYGYGGGIVLAGGE